MKCNAVLCSSVQRCAVKCIVVLCYMPVVMDILFLRLMHCAEFEMKLMRSGDIFRA